MFPVVVVVVAAAVVVVVVAVVVVLVVAVVGVVAVVVVHYSYRQQGLPPHQHQRSSDHQLTYSHPALQNPNRVGESYRKLENIRVENIS